MTKKIACPSFSDQNVFSITYLFLTLDDGTKVVHSKMRLNGTIKICLEKPDVQGCFCHTTCYLPSYATDFLGSATLSTRRSMLI